MADALQETLNKPLTSPISPRMKSAQADVAAARKPMMESMQTGAELAGLEQSMEAGREAQKAKDVSAVQEQYAKASAEAPQREQIREITEKMGAPFVPTQESAAEMAGLFSLINILGFAIGRGGKSNAQQAMSAMNGMMEGFNQGRADRYKQEKATFETNLKQLKTTMDSLQTGLKDALETYSRDRDAGLAKADVLFAQTGADFYKKYAEKYGLAKLYDYHKQVYDEAKKVEDKVYKEEEDARKRSQTLQDQIKIKEWEIEQSDRKMLQKMGTAGPQFAIYQATGKAIPSPKEALAIQSTSTALRDVDSLRQRLKDPNIVTGLQAYPAPFLEKIKSLFGQPLSESEVRSFVDQNLTQTDETTLFIKDAILAGFKIEQGLTGSRVPVFTQRVVGPILDPRSYTPQTYDKLLETRQKDLYNVGADYGFNEDEMNRIARIGGAGSKPVAAPAGAQSQIARPTTEAEFNALPKGAIYIDPDDGKQYRK